MERMERMERMPTSHTLLAGPRGRRLALEFALARESDRDDASHRLDTAVMTAANAFEPSGTLISIGGGPGSAPPPATPADVARLLTQTKLDAPSPRLLRTALARSVDMARYWQEPDGEDQLAATPEVRKALARVAAHLAPALREWASALRPDAQWLVQWDSPGIAAPRAISPEELQTAGDRQVEAERRAHVERPADPHANFSGEWWSMPAWLAPSTMGETLDRSPAGLWFVEDGMGWERAFVYRARIAPDARVCEIDGPQAWAQLCRRFPVDVSASRRHDWFRATGRVGAWVVPDWAALAEHYDGVHLQAAAYLAAAGTAIPVDDDRASVIAGWNPDETYWLTSAVSFESPPHTWVSPGGQGDAWRIQDDALGDTPR
ncbi:hypothetical protein [Microbacterium sp. USHLN186]|uniref:hypothetical protein n=1 Tax=Microbacterium sp. USHLN186 TaxID=3081286 RepID=UPI00301AB0B3